MKQLHKRCDTQVSFDERKITPGYWAVCLECDEDVDRCETYEVKSGMSTEQAIVLRDHFDVHARFSVIDGIVYVDGGLDPVGNPKTWIIKPNGDLYFETGNPLDGYNQELVFNYA